MVCVLFMFYMTCLILCHVFHLETKMACFFLLYPMLDSMSCIIFLSILFDMGCRPPGGLGTNGLLNSCKIKNSKKKHHNFIPSPTTLFHTCSEHSFPLSAPLLSETGASPLDPARIHRVAPPNRLPRSVYRSILAVYQYCGPVSRAAQVPGAPSDLPITDSVNRARTSIYQSGTAIYRS
jgi:hypothetical protein